MPSAKNARSGSPESPRAEGPPAIEWREERTGTALVGQDQQLAAHLGGVWNRMADPSASRGSGWIETRRGLRSNVEAVAACRAGSMRSVRPNLTDERPLSRGHLVKDDTQGEEVGEDPPFSGSCSATCTEACLERSPVMRIFGRRAAVQCGGRDRPEDACESEVEHLRRPSSSTMMLRA